MFKNYIWDFDGTLFDTYPAMVKAFMNSLSSLGIRSDYDYIYSGMKISVGHITELCRKRYGIDDSFSEIFNAERNKTEADIELFPGMKETICSIQARGGRNFLFTHRGYSAIEHTKRCGIYEYFSGFVTNEDGFERKPSPQAILHILKKHELKNSDTVMIGDRDIDLLSGINAGIKSCFFSGGEDKTLDIADYNVKTAAEILGI